MKSAEMIKKLRSKSLKTQEEIAKTLGIARQTYNSYENNLLDCKLETIIDIISAIGLDENEISEFLFALKQDLLSYELNK
jgi:DNA-binding XRE family transcriptional regulator